MDCYKKKGDEFISYLDLFLYEIEPFENEEAFRNYIETEYGEPMSDDDWNLVLSDFKADCDLPDSTSTIDLMKYIKAETLAEYTQDMKVKYYKFDFSENDLILSDFTRSGLKLKDYYYDYNNTIYTWIGSLYTSSEISRIVINSNMISIEHTDGISEKYNITDITDEVFKLEPNEDFDTENAVRSEISYEAFLEDENPNEWFVTLTIDDNKYNLPLLVENNTLILSN